MMKRIQLRAGDADGGFAMISVVLFGVVMLAVTVMTVTQVQQATDHGIGHLSYEREIHLAETGVDQALARLQQNHAWNTMATRTGLATGATPAEEKAWAKDQLEAILDED